MLKRSSYLLIVTSMALGDSARVLQKQLTFSRRCRSRVTFQHAKQQSLPYFSSFPGRQGALAAQRIYSKTNRETLLVSFLRADALFTRRSSLSEPSNRRAWRTTNPWRSCSLGFDENILRAHAHLLMVGVVAQTRFCQRASSFGRVRMHRFQSMAA